MKLIDVHVDGFGIWSDLTLRELSPDCTIFYGPNEAGKTTLLQFIRAVLYGFSPQRTARYLPPVNGAAAGGWLTAEAPEGRLQIRRSEYPQQPLGQVQVQAADGTVQGPAQLLRLLHEVDEIIFQNVFAVSLQELQELGTLTDTDAARWLYDLSLGFDRVSLAEVLNELEKSRGRLWSTQPTSQISQLLAQRAQILRELADLADLSPRLEQLLAEQTIAEQQITQLESELANQEQQHRTLETAAALRDPWLRRNSLNSRIDALGPAAQWPPDAVDRMSQLSAAIRQSRRKQRFLARRRKSLGGKLAQTKSNELLWRQAARIEALAENDGWIVSLEQEIRQAEDTVKRLTGELQSQQQQLSGAAASSAGSKSNQPLAWPLHVDQHVWRTLRRPATALMHAKRQTVAEQQDTQQQRTNQQSQQREVEQALAACGQKNLTAALDTAGQRVTQLRRRVQLDELLDQLSHTKDDLQHAIAGYLERQILPPWMLAAIGGIFVLGVVLILGGLLLPGSFTGSLGWPMAWLGLLGTGSAIAAKYTMERSAANQLDASRRQLAMVESQAQQAETERNDLDRALPKAGGTLEARLQSAQLELAKLEELLPLEAQRQAADQAAQELDSRRAAAEQSYQQAQENWQAALAAVGLPEELAPAQVRALLNAADQLNGIQRQLTDAQEDLDRRRRELSTFATRLEQVFLAADMLPQSTVISDQLRQLRHELSTEENQHRQRRSLLQRRRKLRARRYATAKRLRKLHRRREKLLHVCQVVDLAEFHRRAAEFSQISALMAQRDSAAKEITSLLAGAPRDAAIQHLNRSGGQIGTDLEAYFASLMTTHTADQLAVQIANSRQRLEEIRRGQQPLFEQRGQRSEQIRLLSTDRRPAVKRFELGQVEQQLAAAFGRWQVLTLAHRWLELIKEHYERHRQPETLREASEYLAKFTGGRYQRVWTRWGENSLLVDDNQHRTMPVEVLSQGTREQLFLSLRLAVVSLLARRGIQLPMVLDDVLVNFDTDRAAAAVQVLRDFAERGHQLLIFTCHEHLARLFKANRMDVRRLPAEKESVRDEPFVYEPESQPPPRRTRPRRVKEQETQPPPSVPLTSVVTAQPTGPAISVESTPVEPVEIVPVEAILPFLPPAIEPVVVAEPPPMRIDLPQHTVRLSPIMRRWAAEEFSGELDDRVNPAWLLTDTAWAEMGGSAVGFNGDSGELARNRPAALSIRSGVRYYGGKSVPIVVERPLGDDGQEA